MHSTQRNEGANYQIKRHIKNSFQTKFVKILEIFNILQTSQNQKVKLFLVLFIF